MFNKNEPYAIEPGEMAKLMVGIDWADSHACIRKAHICAIFSQWAYCEIPEWEFKRANGIKMRRAKLFQPSGLFERLLTEQNRTKSSLRELLEIRREARDPEGQNRIQYVTTIDHPLVQAVVLRMNEVIFVSYRGTVMSMQRFISTISDLVSDIWYQKVSPVGGKPELAFHRGFYKAASETFESLSKAISDCCANNGIKKPLIYVTGHSLGGAMAAVLNASWNGSYVPSGLEAYPIRSTYTFGMPRFGDVGTINELSVVEQLTNLKRRAPPNPFGPKSNQAAATMPFVSLFPYHLSNVGDSIPHLPMSYLGFEDSPKEWSSASGLRVGFDYKKCGDDAAFSDLLKLRTLSDHEINRYLYNTRYLAENNIQLA